MNIKSLILCLCLCGIWASAGSAAALSAGDVIKLDRTGAHGGAQGGGEFTIWKLTSVGAAPDVWLNLGVQTFCMEFNEHISLGEKLLVGGISDRAVLGGVGGQLPGSPDPTGQGYDPLDRRTAFLYEKFVTNSLSSLTGFADNSKPWSDALQEAIWHIEQEVSGPISDKAQTLLDFANANAFTGPAPDSVFVLNLFSMGAKGKTDAQGRSFDPYDNTTWSPVLPFHRQDQLFYQPVAPEPSSGALWLGAVCLLAGRARVRRSKSSVSL